MKDVARAAGVSPMTVSRVVSGEPGVSAERVALVEQAVRRLGYRRDDNARRLRKKDVRSSIIGLVVDDLANPFYALMARSVEDAARSRGYLVLVGSTNDEPRREREVIAAFCARRVDGLVLVPTSGGHGFLKREMAGGTKVVCVDRPAHGLAVDTVTVDNRAGARRAVGHLLDLGHTRIGYLGDRLDIWTQRERHSGYLDALAARGVTAAPALVRHGLRGRADAAAAVAELRALAAPPTALFTSNDLITLGALDGPGPPEGCAIVGFDDVPLAERLDPPLSVVSQDPAALGGTAAGLLFSRIDGDHAAPRSVVLLTRFIPRGSGVLTG
ncbi:LacI family DNA-binding transcriptional regulator [Streptacidiphilus rugosus]|uniref:LacI family DNA-binding transcriptional regulator n=1 Tax=Streptacidiphilus rugosus TaxID=405783 RepID=UPI00056312E3|nr:LacI family DNA-binding transcriptional regulator [Streptacidiphilus rugosus]